MLVFFACLKKMMVVEYGGEGVCIYAFPFPSPTVLRGILGIFCMHGWEFSVLRKVGGMQKMVIFHNFGRAKKEIWICLENGGVVGEL